MKLWLCLHNANPLKLILLFFVYFSRMEQDLWATVVCLTGVSLLKWFEFDWIRYSSKYSSATKRWRLAIFYDTKKCVCGKRVAWRSNWRTGGPLSMRREPSNDALQNLIHLYFLGGKPIAFNPRNIGTTTTKTVWDRQFVFRRNWKGLLFVKWRWFIISHPVDFFFFACNSAGNVECAIQRWHEEYKERANVCNNILRKY